MMERRAYRRSLTPLRVLVTGFGPFPGVPFNASTRLIEALERSPAIAGISLFSEIIPVAWDGALDCSQKAIGRHRPHAVLHFGVAKRATLFEIETRAFNMSGPKADNEGRVRGERFLVPGSPFIRTATLPAAELLHALRQAGCPAALSKNAGRYLCNALFYTSLNNADKSGAPLVGFIHIPAFGIDTDVTPRLTMDQAVDGARILIRASAKAVLRSGGLHINDRDGRRRLDGSQGVHGNKRSGGRIAWRGGRSG